MSEFFLTSTFLPISLHSLFTLAISNSALQCVLFERSPTITSIMPLIHQQLALPKARGGDGSLQDTKGGVESWKKEDT